MRLNKVIELTHANLDVKVFLLLHGIAGYHYSPTSKCTYVYTLGGVVPVKESNDVITNILNNLKGDEDGI